MYGNLINSGLLFIPYCLLLLYFDKALNGRSILSGNLSEHTRGLPGSLSFHNKVLNLKNFLNTGMPWLKKYFGVWECWVFVLSFCLIRF